MGNRTSLHKDLNSSNSREGEKIAGGLDLHANVMDSAALPKNTELDSRDEIFFDSKACMDSDCDDDFYSVRGDFTPSRGNTPVHPSSILATPHSNKIYFDGNPPTPPEPSPRKKLSQLLLEISMEEKVDGKGESEATCTTPTATNGTPSKSLNGSPKFPENNKANGIQKSPKSRLKHGKVKNDQTMQCCLPAVHGFSIHDWKKPRTSPMHQDVAANGIKTSVAG